ncbi:hypothetical protein ACWT_7426 [Actinoplanes sp. SE50]|nr:hypothetical protein ACPL_7556 [Actinoplanes sp. SE50/110]ATO86841.1 hypothetical protein ACWT_7426 [Actinoplanes sp. SE50]SLM04259.1 hypothetical protein ACSP50_7562 [Actinoplanes sp. SE50/110]
MTTAAASLEWGVRLLYLQCAGLAGLTAYLIVLDLTRTGADVGVAAALTVLAALAAVAVFLVARALGRRRVRARGPAVVVQLFLLATGGFLVQVGPLWLGVVLLVVAAVTAVLVLLPASSRALGVD